MRILLGGFMVYAGIGHLTFSRIEFQAQVPAWVPVDADLVVVVSGIIEIVLGTLTIVPGRFRIVVGLVLASFYVLVFPGNLSQYLRGIDAFGLNTDRARLIRLLFQPVLVLWALWATGALDYLTGKVRRK